MDIDWKKILANLAILSVIMLVMILWPRKDRPDDPKPKPDTVYVHRYKPEPPYKIVEVPKTVFLFGIDTVKVKEVSADIAHIHVTLGNNQVIDYSTQFLAQYPNANKLVQMVIKANELKLTQFNSRAQLITDVYNFYPNLYDYNYVNQTMTSKPIGFFRRFGLSADFMARPVSSLYDINLGLIHKTSNIIYEVGINTHYYQPLTNKVGIDPYLRIRFQI